MNAYQVINVLGILSVVFALWFTFYLQKKS